MKAFLIGLQFLTRIRLLKQTEWKNEDFGKSVVWFPVVGLVIGLCLCAVCFIAKPYVSGDMLAFLLVAGEFFLTGAMHADGLMDTCDGFFSGRSRERSLEIMKDSCVGSFGLLAFVFLVFFKVFSLAGIQGELWTVLIAMPVAGRLTMVMSICMYPYARPQGIGKAFAVYCPKHTLALAFLISLLPALLLGFSYLLALGAAMLISMVLNDRITARLGGVTGDTYGAVTEISEAVIAFLFMILSKGVIWHF